MLSLMDTMVSLVVKVLYKFISLICFRVCLEVNVYKNPIGFSYWSASYINRIIFDYDELKKEKKDIPPIEETKFCFGAKVDGENLLKD